MKTLDWGDIDVSWLAGENVILDKVGILDILDKCRLEYTAVSSGDFAYRMRCPFPWHADGAERTASMYISKDQDSFYCFGCNYNGNTINFAQYLLGKPYDKAIEWLMNMADISGDLEDIPTIHRAPRKPEETISFYILKAGSLIRQWLKISKNSPNYEHYCWWAERQFSRMDSILDKDDNQWEEAKMVYDKICERLEKYITKEQE